MPRMTRRIVAGAAATAALAMVAAAPAVAATGDAAVAPCSSHVAEHPFTAWLDPLSYVQAPGGSFEADGPAWALSGGASVVDGNEPFKVGGATDSKSLRLPAGASATSPPMCVNLLYPTVRFFSKSDSGLLGSLLATQLKVDVLYTDVLGIRHADPLIAVNLSGGKWQPSTLPGLMLANANSVLQGGEGTVAFRFTAKGGGYTVDDVYVDPWLTR